MGLGEGFEGECLIRDEGFDWSAGDWGLGFIRKDGIIDGLV